MPSTSSWRIISRRSGLFVSGTLSVLVNRPLRIRVAAMFQDRPAKPTEAIHVTKALIASKAKMMGQVRSRTWNLLESPQRRPYGCDNAFIAKQTIQKETVGPGTAVSAAQGTGSVPFSLAMISAK
jgi:hypothetical protein